MAGGVAGIRMNKRVRLDYKQDEEAIKDFITRYRTNIQLEPKYTELVQSIRNRESKTFALDLDDVEAHKSLHPAQSGLAERIEGNPASYEDHISKVLDELIEQTDVTVEEIHADIFDFLKDQEGLRAREQAAPGAAAKESFSDKLKRRYEVQIVPRKQVPVLTVRQLKSRLIGKLTTVSGICVSVSPVRPKAVVQTYLCDQCNDCVYQECLGSKFQPITQCQSLKCKTYLMQGRLFLQNRACKFTQHQELRLQELPSDVPKGCVPRTLKVVCEGGAAGLAKPGAVVRVSGVLVPNSAGNAGGSVFKSSVMTPTQFKAYTVHLMKQDYEAVLTEELEEHVNHVRSTYDDEALMEKLARSLAPEIWGLDDVKRVLFTQLIGGVSLERNDGLRLRGDINVCLMGDPGVAKSQLLRWVSALCPRSVFTTGKGSSGVGLTASVSIDEHTREAVLESGALVLSDRGICCIDEFDKMDDGDRTSIHEVMEQQSISVAKGGIITSLNARTAVLAAANPQFGRWKGGRTCAENINLPPSLLSRFDVLWLLIDSKAAAVDSGRDEALAEHVLKVHQFGRVVAQGRDAPRDGDGDFGLSEDQPYFKRDFMRAYIAAAKRRDPFLEPEVIPVVQDYYCELRKDEALQGADATTYTTPRNLLSILRMGQALARIRLAKSVSLQDVKEAQRLMRTSKESIADTQRPAQGGSHRDPITQIYHIIKDVSGSERTTEVATGSAAREKIKFGKFSDDEFRQCLDKYEKLDVWQVVYTGDTRDNPSSIEWL